jgi:hypothetical protein
MVWLRVPGDIVFTVGGIALALFVARLYLRRKTGVVAARPAIAEGAA